MEQRELADRARVKEQEERERREREQAAASRGSGDKSNPPQKLTFGFQKKKSSLF